MNRLSAGIRTGATVEAQVMPAQERLFIDRLDNNCDASNPEAAIRDRQGRDVVRK